MTKDLEHNQQQQLEYHPSQMPTAPPSYYEAVNTQGSGQCPQYPTQPPSAFMPPPPQSAVGTSFYPRQPPIIEVQSTIVTLPLGPNSARIKCPHCQAEILTRIETEPNCAAHLCCLLLLLIGFCPCSSLPYFMDSLKNVRHSCPNCKGYLGVYHP